jgi:hypothetical protein
MKMKRLLGLGALVVALAASTSARAEVQTEEILTAVKAAFTTWEGIDCTNLKFEFAGTLDEFVTEKEGAILVYFGHSNLTWKHGNHAYYSNVAINEDPLGDIRIGVIGLNARDFKWVFGKDPRGIDIQTAVLHLIPSVIGFYIGTDQQGYSLKETIKYDYADHDLDPLQEKGAQFSYFKAGAGCTQPPQPPICGQAAKYDGGTPSDAGGDMTLTDAAAADAALADATVADTAVADAAIVDAAASDAAVDAGVPPSLCIFHSVPNNPSEGKYYHWVSQPIKYYVFIPNRGKLPGSTVTKVDGSHDGISGENAPPQTCTKDEDCPGDQICVNNICVNPGGGDDDGCCRVSHSRGENLTGIVLLALGLGLLLACGRRRRR